MRAECGGEVVRCPFGWGYGRRALAVSEAGWQDASYVSSGGGRYAEAQHLSLGDRLLAREFSSATVVGLTVRNERLKVYNLTVLRLHNYAVGAAGLLAHNLCNLKIREVAGTVIEGSAHASKKHVWKTYRKTISMAKSGRYSRIVLNRSITKATAGRVTSRLRPDIVGKLKGINAFDVFEVQSPSQSWRYMNSKIASIKQIFGSVGRTIDWIKLN